jgi:hypothetical protein
MFIYTIIDNKTNREYYISSFCEVPLDVVWASQKNWWNKGASLTIKDEKGNAQTFNK